MKETIAYFKAKERLSEPVLLEEVKEKFKDKPIKQILDKLLEEGLIFEPKIGVYRWLGE